MLFTSRAHSAPLFAPVTRLAPFALCLLVGACSHTDANDGKRVRSTRAPLRASAGCAERLVTGGGVGPVRVGMSLDSLRLACRILAETSDSATNPRSPTRLVSVALGRDTGIAMVKASRVQQLRVSGAGFTTPDSIGTGTTLGILLARHEVTGFVLDGRVYARSANICDLVFRFHSAAPLTPDRNLDSTALAHLPPTLPVDEIAAWGDCEPPDTAKEVITVRVDSVVLERDLDGDGRPDLLVREARMSSSPWRPRAHRLSLYLGARGRAKPAWSTDWDEFDESDPGLVGIWPVGSGTSVMRVDSQGADYDGELFVLVSGGKARNVVSHGENYGRGSLTVTAEQGRFVIDATQETLMLHERPVLPEARCGAGQMSAVRLTFDERRHDFVADHARCVEEP